MTPAALVAGRAGSHKTVRLAAPITTRQQQFKLTLSRALTTRSSPLQKKSSNSDSVSGDTRDWRAFTWTRRRYSDECPFSKAVGPEVHKQTSR